MELRGDPEQLDLSYYMLQHPNLPRHLFRPETPSLDDTRPQHNGEAVDMEPSRSARQL